MCMTWRRKGLEGRAKDTQATNYSRLDSLLPSGKGMVHHGTRGQEGKCEVATQPDHGG